MPDSHFENELSAFLDRHFSHPPLPDRCPPHLAESIRYSLLAPGKRIRPRLLAATGRLVGIPDEASLRAGIALEIIHCFTLIHDDLPCMDNSDTRRGRPANHKKFGESIALLAGDALVALALDAWAELDEWISPTFVLRGLRRFSSAIGPRGVCGGQAAESLLLSQPSLNDLRWVHAQKTGALFSAAILLPCDLAGMSPDTAAYQTLDRYAAALGLAFQIADDIEDAEQDWNPKTAQYTVTSILHYLPKDQASQESRGLLENACRELSTQWHDQKINTEPLLQIAEEVLKKLR